MGGRGGVAVKDGCDPRRDRGGGGPTQTGKEQEEEKGGEAKTKKTRTTTTTPLAGLPESGGGGGGEGGSGAGNAFGPEGALNAARRLVEAFDGYGGGDLPMAGKIDVNNGEPSH